MRRSLLPALLLGLAFPAAAFAHAYPQTASPPLNGTVAKAPASLWISFDDELEPHFTSATVIDSAGHRVDLGDAHVAPADPHRLLLGLKPLAAGTYTVRWKATDTDTHKTHGEYHFTIAP